MKKLYRSTRFIALALGIAYLSSGCSATVKQLKGFKEHSAAQQYSWIADQEVKCEAKKAGCNQLHLIMGDACFNLAKQATAKADKIQLYRRAADELATGIAQTSKWESGKLNLDRSQTYENLCESLRNLQDLQEGEAARAVGERLLETAETFFNLAPQSLAATYFFSKARFRKIQPALLEVTEANSAQICTQLNSLQKMLDASMQRAKAASDPLWARYEQPYFVHLGELKLAKKTIAGCQ